MKLKYLTFFLFILLLILTITSKSAESTKLIYMDNLYKDKTWLTLGDSITKSGIYQSNLSKKFKYIDNKGVNGQTMAYQCNHNSTYELGKGIDYKKYDLVTIFIGTNDFRYHKPLGSLQNINSNNFNDKTYFGAYQLLIEYIQKSNPNIEIILITPIQRVKDGFDIHYFNNENNQLIDYVNATKKIANLYSLSVIDLYSESGITKENMNIYTRDGLHPNEKGYKIISKHIENALFHIKE